MGATAITVLAAAQVLTMPPAPPVTATRPVVAGLAVALWAFGTWLTPRLVIFGIWRHGLNRVRLIYLPALWSIVFPLGMYAAASMHLGQAARMPIVEHIGRDWSTVAVAAWLLVFTAMYRSLLGTTLRALQRASTSGATVATGPRRDGGDVG